MGFVIGCLAIGAACYAVQKVHAGTDRWVFLDIEKMMRTQVQGKNWPDQVLEELTNKCPTANVAVYVNGPDGRYPALFVHNN
jgi:hypothetical protein